MSFFVGQLIVHVLWDLYRASERGKTDDELRRSRLDSEREHEIRLARTRWLERNGAHASFPCGIAAVDEPVGSAAGSPSTSSPPAGAPLVGPEARGQQIPPRPDVSDASPTRVVPVTVAVTGDAFVFLREGVAEVEDDRVVEVGRFPRAAFASAHLEDAEGRPAAAPLADTFEPASPCRLVVTWRRDDGTDDQDAFAFMSLSVAGEAAERFRRFAASA